MRMSRGLIVPLALVFALVTACTNAPPPPLVTSAPPPTTSAQPGSQIVIGMDGITGGYNPHNVADLSTATTALAQLLLPSVFRPGPDGTPTLDKNLMRSAEVLSEQPFKVAYEIRPDASWSDSAPIAVEDFVYLSDAMRNEPGTVQAAGYRLISGIQPGEGGKRVEVTFSKPYPGWRTLFSDLLPAHLLKDSPGGWKSALASSFPAYGGPFSIKNLDRDRGEIILERNERYWEKPAVLDRVVIRRADQPGLAAAMRSGTTQFVMARTDAAGLKLLGDLGSSVQLHTVATSRVAEVLLRPIGSVLSQEQTRAGIAALIDRDKLIDQGVAGGPSATLRANAQVLPPSATGYKSTVPPANATANPAKAQELLEAAGYKKDAGTWRDKNGKTLSLVVAAPGDLEPYASVAKTLVDQLIAAGIEVRMINPQPRDLFSSLLATPASKAQPQLNVGSGVGVDIAVIPQVMGGDPASALASTFGCRPGEQDIDPSVPVVPANPAAFCEASLQSAIDAALTGATPMAEALSALEPELWRRHVVIPLFQVADTVAIGAAIGAGTSGVTVGPPFAGPFAGAAEWTRSTPPGTSTGASNPATPSSTPPPATSRPGGSRPS